MNKNNFSNAKLSQLLALAVAMNLFELIIPKIPFLPWLKLGLANTIQISVVVLFSPLEALQFVFLRVLLSGFLSGSPATSFVFSLGGGIGSVIIMIILWQFLGTRKYMGLIGIGIAGAFVHNTTQLFIAYSLFVKNNAFLWQFPFLTVFSIISGTITGLLAHIIINAVENSKTIYNNKIEIISKFTFSQKLMFYVLLTALISVFFISDYIYISIFFFVALLTSMYFNVNLNDIFKIVKRFWALFLWNILLNIFFTQGRYIYHHITYEGIHLATSLCIKLILCIIISLNFMKIKGIEYSLHLFSRITSKKDFLIIFYGALDALPKVIFKTKTIKWKTLLKPQKFITEFLD